MIITCRDFVNRVVCVTLTHKLLKSDIFKTSVNISQFLGSYVSCSSVALSIETTSLGCACTIDFDFYKETTFVLRQIFADRFYRICFNSHISSKDLDSICVMLQVTQLLVVSLHTCTGG